MDLFLPEDAAGETLNFGTIPTQHLRRWREFVAIQHFVRLCRDFGSASRVPKPKGNTDADYDTTCLMATLLPDAHPVTPADGTVVLAVEESETDFPSLERAFQQAGIKVRLEWAKDGLEVKEYLDKAIIVGRLPVCIIIGLKLPRMDGFELLAYIKATPGLNAIPVNVLSVSSSPVDMARAYRLGANTYLVKPTRLESLVQMSLAIQSQWTASQARPPQEK